MRLEPDRPRFRLMRAYLVTVRVLASYLALRLRRPFLTPDAYERRLLERHRVNARRVERAIIELDGLFIKVGQLISILANFLPEEFRRELEGLQDAIPARPIEQIVERIEREFGRGPQTLFAWWNPDPMASASLAQVHEARMHNGQRVAVKVQHADIDEIAQLDLTAIRRILAVVQFFTRLRGLESYHTEVSAMIREELDFRQEAENIARIASHFDGDPMVEFPVVIKELSTEKVLTTELVDATKVTDLAELERRRIDRPALAQRILTAYCQMIFVDGVYHADPHPGNILVRDDGSIVFVDFGAVGELSRDMKEGIPQFLEGVIKREPPKITGALRRMGFVARVEQDGRAPDEEGVAERVIEYFQRRFLEQVSLESFSLKDVQVDVRAKAEMLADLRKLDVSFRELTRTFQVPKDWVLLERTILLLLGLCTTLDPAMAPMRTIQPYLEEFVLGRDHDMVALVRSAVKDMALSVLTLPQGVTRLVARANRGDLEVRVQGLRESANLVYAAAQQLVFGVLAAGSGVIAYLARSRGDRFMATSTSIAAALFLFGMLRSMWKAKL
ncbi:MAG TPA: AarF/ABC1/UbiB kinase family protein [Gemmatimonadaceae bacterium]|nr:AarF/ABC1/UbiB kinase family protein [Gemmatimonadaceae bacterium]